jgi:hypothetical protein
MVPTAASTALNAPSLPTAPAAVSADPTKTSNTQFRDVYQSVPADEKAQSDQGSKQKSASSKPNPIQKGGGEDEKGKITVPAAVPAGGVVLPKAPLLLTIPSLGLAGQIKTPDGWAGDALKQIASEGGDANPAASLPRQAAAAGPDIKPALPRLDTLAISFQLLAPNRPGIHGKATQQPLPAAPPPSILAVKQAPREAQHSAPLTNGAASLHELNPLDLVKGITAPQVLMPLHAFSPGPTGDLRQAALAYEPGESIHIAPSVAVHDVAMAPESPKATATSEILLHLSGNDQSTAAVRVIDRSGTVNVAVHASDPVLRTSLRSNLGELATQLNGQGFKTDIVKSTGLAAHADNARDSRHDGERSTGQQQQSTPGERQSQRQRRTGSERWLDELEQETSGDAGSPGGTN